MFFRILSFPLETVMETVTFKWCCEYKTSSGHDLISPATK